MVQMLQIWVWLELFHPVFTSLVLVPSEVGTEQWKCFRKLLGDFFDPHRGFSVVGSSEIPGIFLSHLVKTENVLTSAQLILIRPDQTALANLNNLQDRRFLIITSLEANLSSSWMASAEKNRNKWLSTHWSSAGQLKVATNLQQKNTVCSQQFYYRKYQDFCKSFHFSKEKVNLSLRCQLRVIQIPGETLAAHANGHDAGLVYKIVEIYAKWAQVDLFTDTVGVSEFLNNGSLQAILAHLENNSYDVATGPLFINSLTVDYGPVLYKDSYIFAIKKFKVEVRKMYITVFQNAVWRCWYAAFLAACFFYRFTNFSLGNNIGLHKSLLDILRLSLGTGLTTRRFTSLRVFMVCFLLANLIICTVYTGRISSILTASHFEKATIKKLYSIMIRPDVHYLYSAYMDSLLGVTEVGKRRMSRDGLEDLLIKTNWTEWENLQHVLFKENGYYAAVTLKSLSLVHPSESELFDTFVALQPFTWLMTFYISKQSPLRNSMKFWTNEMYEKGLTNKWLADILEENRKHSRVRKQQPHKGNAISFNNFKEFYVVLGVGYGCGLGALILEFVCFWMESRFKVKERVVALLLLLKPPEDLWRK